MASSARSSICEVQPYLYISCYGSSVVENKLRAIGICTIFTKLSWKYFIIIYALILIGITHCVDVANNVKSVQIPGIKYHFVGVNDDDRDDIKVHFQATADFIQSAKSSVQKLIILTAFVFSFMSHFYCFKGGKVLVYCAAGVSRSATICIMSLVSISCLKWHKVSH